MGAKKNVDKTVATDTIKILSQEGVEPTDASQIGAKSEYAKSSKSTKSTNSTKSKKSTKSTKTTDKVVVDEKESAGDIDQTIDQELSTDQTPVDSTKADVAINEEKATQSAPSDTDSASKTPKVSRTRGKRYVTNRSMVDRTIDYPLAEAIDLVTKTSYSKFAGTITADLVVREIGDQGTLTFPHSTGKTIKVEVASDETLAKLEKGVIDFDILLTEPTFVPKLAKYARILGPKGLMPNPKNGTITAQPAKRKKELEAGAVTIKSERKAPLCHVIIGNTKMSKSELLANAETLLTTLKGRVLKITLSATMGPGVKVKVEK